MSTVFVAARAPLREPFADAPSLESALRRATQGAASARVAVAVHSVAGTVVASVGGADEAVPIGCVAKLLTATLVRAAARQARLSLDDELGALLGPVPWALRGITLRQLLEHRHGLDDSALAPPRYRRGFLDDAELGERVATLARFAAPGECYSYGHLGAWLAAVALERVHARRFTELARAWLRDSLDLRAADAPAICPALGSGLALPAGELARFVARATAGLECDAHGTIAPLPGWNPLERGVCLGFKHSGGDWLGHQSAWPGASAYVRGNAASGVGLAIVARTHPAAVVAARLLGGAHPELFQLRPPAPHAADAADAHWPGRYAQAALEVTVASRSEGLALEARSSHEPAQSARARLMPSGGPVRFASPANELVPFAQLVRVPGEGAPWLWNGRCLLRRTPDQSGSRR